MVLLRSMFKVSAKYFLRGIFVASIIIIIVGSLEINVGMDMSHLHLFVFDLSD